MNVAPYMSASLGTPRARGAVAGFTMIELMLVLVLAGVLLGLAAPSFQESLRRNRLQSALGDTISMLSFARAEAAARGAPVAICASTDFASCSGSNWETGWIAFADDGTGAGATAQDGALGGGEEMLRIGDPAAQQITIRTLNFPATTHIIFMGDGRLERNTPGTFTICDARGASEARALIVNVSGQARLATDSNGDSVVENDLGGAVVCP